MGTALQIIGFIVLAATAERAASASFEFCFTKWPARAPLDCNPYSTEVMHTDLHLVCGVNGPQNLEIKWFYSEHLQANIENTSVPLQNSSKYLIQTVKQTLSSGTVRTMCRLRVKVVRQGHYWCRAYQNGAPLWPVSQKMDLADEASYFRYEPCGTDIQSEQTQKCHYVHVESSSTLSSSVPGVSTTPPLMKAPSTSSSSSWQTTTTTPATSNPTMTSTTNMQLQPTSSEQPTNMDTTSTDTQRPMNTVPRRPTSSTLPQPTQTSIDRGELTGVPDDYQVWLFVVVGLTVLFAVLIVALSIICVGLCVLKSRASKKAKEENSFSNRGSPHHQRRPSTSMTQQTDLMICLPDTAIYSTLERDYEDLDDKDEPDTEVAPSPPPHKQHHYGGELTRPDLPIVPHYSALANDAATGFQQHRTPDPDIIEQLTGYGKLDHTKPRQNYHPNTHSPLLSGYRKLEHVSRGFTQSSTSSTLPHSLDGPYANIYPAHVRASSISGDDFKHKGKIEAVNPLPVSPLNNSPRSRGYLNFQVIEQQEASLGNSDSYHMLEDITADKDMLTLQGIDLEVQDYEYLPTVGSEDEGKTYDNLTPAVDPTTPVKRALGAYLAKDPLAEQMSVDSSHSGDFTGPFFLPHMLNSMGQAVDQTDNHTYKCLDLATIEPDQNYAVPEAQPKRKTKGY